jgi:hypothetical protein
MSNNSNNSNNLLREIDIKYLTNTSEYEKHVKKQIDKKINKKDKKFYKKRIYSLTKELLTNDEIIINHDIKKQFDEYIQTCIDYFKTLDNNDIIQNDYNLLNVNNNENDIINENTLMKSQEDANNLLIRSINVKNSLDNFVIKNKIKIKKNDMILPKQKNINLRDPILKKKGIKISSKKKNIRNNYENKHTKDTTIEETQTNI